MGDTNRSRVDLVQERKMMSSRCYGKSARAERKACRKPKMRQNIILVVMRVACCPTILEPGRLREMFSSVP